MLKIKFLGPEELFEAVDKLIRRPRSRCSIAVAYLKQTGLAHFEVPLKTAEAKIIAGTSSFHVTEWQTLSTLLRLSELNPKLLVRTYYNEGFHPKIFYFEQNHRATAVIGSSNLTGGGFGTNVEANVMVEGSLSDVFFTNLRKFFQRIFNRAESLNEDFLDNYKKEYKRDKRRTRHRRSLLSRTPLPSHKSRTVIRSTSLEIPNTAKWWKIAPGRDGEDWPLWKEHIDSDYRGYVAIGWAEIGNVSRALSRSYNDLDTYVRNRKEKRPGYVCKQFWSFGKLVKKKDIVVVYSERTIFGIAQIEGGLMYRPNINPRFPNLRAVNWLALLGIKAPKTIMSTIATNDTIHHIDDTEVISYLKSVLRKHSL
jgi:HKD family nuclease